MNNDTAMTKTFSLDIAREPYSARGSYFSIIELPAVDWAPLGKGVYIQTHHAGQHQVFKVNPVRRGRIVACRVDAGPAAVRMICRGGGEVTMVISPEKTVRIRATGVGIRLEAPALRWCYTHQLAKNVWSVFNNTSKWSFVLDPLAGGLTMDAPWVQRKSLCKESERIVALLNPDDNGVAEIAIDECGSGWARPRRQSFAACLAERERELKAWFGGLPPVESALAAAYDRAAYVNWSCIVAPNGYLKRQTMLMGKAGMCHVFSWDHAFNAMAHVRHDPDLAWDQLMVMADQQDACGRVPDNMNDQSIAYTYGKPPVQGWAAQYMMQRNPKLFTRSRLEELYHYLSLANNWLLNYRTWPGDTLPYYTHGFDSGWDNSTIFDKGVPLVSPDLAAYLALQMEFTGEIASRLGRKKEAVKWAGRSRRMIDDLVSILWRDNRFVGLVKPDDDAVVCRSLICCMPIVLGMRLPAAVRQALVGQIRGFVTRWGLATEHPDSQEYNGQGYWRGGIWAPSTLLILSGLAQVGEQALADRIAGKFIKVCRKSGFAENFDALEGKGCYCSAYTWTSSVFMMLAESCEA